jgi:hypothetical protein
VITHIQFDVFIMDETGLSCWSFFDFFFINANKSRYQNDMRKWWKKEALNYREEKIMKLNACQRKFGIKKYYPWIEKKSVWQLFAENYQGWIANIYIKRKLYNQLFLWADPLRWYLFQQQRLS